jgi:hypothetical protein
MKRRFERRHSVSDQAKRTSTKPPFKAPLDSAFNFRRVAAWGSCSAEGLSISLSALPCRSWPVLNAADSLTVLAKLQETPLLCQLAAVNGTRAAASAAAKRPRPSSGAQQTGAAVSPAHSAARVPDCLLIGCLAAVESHGQKRGRAHSQYNAAGLGD